MIHLKITGRCGNQLFQYAFIRYLSTLIGESEFCIDFSWIYQTGVVLNEPTFEDQLKNFNTLSYTSVTGKDSFDFSAMSRSQVILRKFGTFLKILSQKLLGNKYDTHTMLEPWYNRMGIYCHECSKTKQRKTKQKDLFVKGYFEDKRYFDKIRPILLEEFTPRYPEKEKNNELYKIIREKESVCVSFRKWGEVPQEVKETRDVCGEAYYKNAIAKMRELKPDAVFIIFSDDIEWVKKTYDFGDIPVFYEDGTDEIWEKIRLMYSCKHFIMTTSTFAWWAQYLCRNKEKIVIGPNHWYSDPERDNRLIDSSWILIET